MKHLIISLLVLLLFAQNVSATQQPTTQTSAVIPTALASSIQQAKNEGKLVIIDFYASWCAPCRWMEEKTYADPDVMKFVKKYYVMHKADLDQTDGFELFNQYGVTSLPTMLLINGEGEILERTEEPMAAVQLLEILHKFSDNLQPVQNLAYSEQEGTETKKAPGLLFEPILEQVKQVEEANLAAFAPPPTGGFSVQIGVFTLYPNIKQVVDGLQPNVQTPFWVEEQTNSGTTIFKLLSGHFPSRGEAEQHRAKLASLNTPGYIRSL